MDERNERGERSSFLSTKEFSRHRKKKVTFGLCEDTDKRRHTRTTARGRALGQPPFRRVDERVRKALARRRTQQPWFVWSTMARTDPHTRTDTETCTERQRRADTRLRRVRGKATRDSNPGRVFLSFLGPKELRVRLLHSFPPLIRTGQRTRRDKRIRTTYATQQRSRTTPFIQNVGCIPPTMHPWPPASLFEVSFSNKYPVVLLGFLHWTISTCA